MTISTETTVSGPYAGDDATTEFAISFVFWDNADIRAIKRVTATGVETVLALGTHYTLAGGSGATGTLTTTGGNTIATGETLTIKSARAVTQPTSIPLGGEFPSTAVEQALDQNVRLIQQQSEELERVVKFAETSPDSDVTFPDVTGNANKTIRVNAAGDGLEAATPTDGGDLGLPISLGDGGTNADLSAPTALTSPRINSAGTAMELRTPTQRLADLGLEADFEDVASATTTDIGAADSRNVRITGTTTITGLGTVAAGTTRRIRFAAALTLTHNGTSLILPGADDITTEANATADGVSLGSGNWIITNYQRADGTPISTLFTARQVQSKVSVTSGTTKDFTGIPAWATKVELTYDALSTNGTTGLRLQLGDSGGIEATGYTGGATNLENGNVSNAALSTAHILEVGTDTAAADVRIGTVVLRKHDTNQWVITGDQYKTNDDTRQCSQGSKTLSAALTQIRLTMDGTDEFDGSGTATISWS